MAETKMKTKFEAEDFKKSAEKNNITEWRMHDCSLCGYKCGFKFIDEKVFYDNGCYCVMMSPRLCSWESVANHYNIQTDEDIIKKYKEFWRFT